MFDFFINFSVRYWVQLQPRRVRSLVAAKTLRQNHELHPHPFVILAADDGTQNFIFPRFSRRDQGKLLRARLKFQVPAAYLVMALGPPQGKPMDRAIAVPGLDRKSV